MRAQGVGWAVPTRHKQLWWAQPTLRFFHSLSVPIIADLRRRNEKALEPTRWSRGEDGLRNARLMSFQQIKFGNANTLGLLYMNKWSHLPNARLIDWVLKSLKTDPNAWKAAWGKERDAEWSPAMRP